jgi:hypothetical protein
MTISRMQNPQQLQGIGSLRQRYGLGKLVKKAFRGIKKIVKSPIGKAAILGGLGMWGMGAGGFGGLKGAGWLRNLGTASKGGGIWNAIRGGAGGIGKMLNPWAGGTFSGKKLFGLAAGAGIAMPFIQKALKWGPYGQEEEEETDWTQTPGSILNLRNQAKDYYKAATPDYTGSPFMPAKQFVMPNFYAAEGGRAGLLNGGEAGEAQIEQMLRAEYLKYKNQGGTMPYEQFKILVMKQAQQAQQGQTPNQMMAAGGRIGYGLGSWVKGKLGLGKKEARAEPHAGTVATKDPNVLRQKLLSHFKAKMGGGDDEEDFKDQLTRPFIQAAQGGRVGAQEGGLMDLGGQEKDYRENGGFVPIGGEERADDVPARLSKNEFVFTADAVRAAGGGDIDAGSEVMQNVMDNLEQGGEVSEDSQGLGGGEEMMSEEIIEGPNPAQGMYDNYEQLQSRVA